MESTSEEIDLTPMLDIIFIILIFFIVSASFIKELGLDVGGEKSKTKEATQITPIVVIIDENKRIRVEGVVTTIEGLQPMVKKLRAMRPKAAVIIHPMKSAKTDSLVLALDKLAIIGIRAKVVMPR